MAGRNAGHFWRFYGTVVPKNKEECEEVVNCLSKRFCIQNKEQHSLSTILLLCYLYDDRSMYHLFLDFVLVCVF